MFIAAQGLGQRFPGTAVLFEHVSFTVEPGQTVALCGPSGCGKSTLLAILAGWCKPTAGTVESDGVKRVGWVFQNPYGVARRSAVDHVSFPLLAQGRSRSEAEDEAYAALDLFGLGHVAQRLFSELSGGEAQRLMLARAVCSRPDVLLVDEPTAQLDTRTAHGVNSVLGNLAERGMMVVVATHDMDTRDACQYVVDLARYTPADDGGDEGMEQDGGRKHRHGVWERWFESLCQREPNRTRRGSMA